MNYFLIAWAIAGVVSIMLQPILGWHAIPAFFNYSKPWAMAMGVFDVAMIATPLGILAYLNR